MPKAEAHENLSRVCGLCVYVFFQGDGGDVLESTTF